MEKCVLLHELIHLHRCFQGLRDCDVQSSQTFGDKRDGTINLHSLDVFRVKVHLSLRLQHKHGGKE